MYLLVLGNLFLSDIHLIFLVQQKKIIEAVAGNDIEVPGLTSIILDASKSTPNNGSLTYEWSFPENLIFEEDYEDEENEEDYY